MFALSNGHIGLRGNLDEGEPHGIPGTYLNSVYELRPLPYAEAGYGYPESGQSIINVTNGKLIRLLVNDEPFDVRYGDASTRTSAARPARRHARRGSVQWTSPAGSAVRVTSLRLVSLTQRAVAAIRYEVEAVDEPFRVVVQSELVANEPIPDLRKDPRVAADARLAARRARSPTSTRTGAVDGAPDPSERAAGRGGHVPRDRRSGRHAELLEGADDVSRVTVTARLAQGQKLRIVKYLAYGWSAERAPGPALHDQVVAALAGARRTTGTVC